MKAIRLIPTVTRNQFNFLFVDCISIVNVKKHLRHILVNELIAFQCCPILHFHTKYAHISYKFTN